MTEGDRAQARRIFEETLVKVQQHYAATGAIMVEARIEDMDGRPVVVARYKLYTDGRIECFQVLDEVLWPSVTGGDT